MRSTGVSTGGEGSGSSSVPKNKALGQSGTGPTSSAKGSETAQFAAPSIAPPKGGGALRGIGEKFLATPSTGAASLEIPLALPMARGESTPSLALRYSSGSGNSPFGLGWSLSAPSITRKTDKGLPQYTDEDEFVLAGSEDLVRSVEPEMTFDGLDALKAQIKLDAAAARRLLPAAR